VLQQYRVGCEKTGCEKNAASPNVMRKKTSLKLKFLFFFFFFFFFLLRVGTVLDDALPSSARALGSIL
jgi:hypothetical protein